ncbi:MAG: alpha/beta hydrolase [Patescibacteria group bacterium]
MKKKKEQKSSLIQIETSDGLTLPGIFYEVPQSKKAAIFLHGNGSASVFYKDDFRGGQAKALQAQSIATLLFNNRGAHYIKSLHVKKKNGEEERELFGMTFEKIKDCVFDIDAAVTFLKKLGYTEFYLVGESTGANKICVYDHYKKDNLIAKYILLGGGDDTGIYYDILGKECFNRLLKEAKEKIAQKKGKELIAELLPDDFFSYQAFYDTANPDGDYNTFPFLEALRGVKLSQKKRFRYFQAIRKPTLVVYGESDQYLWGELPRIISILREKQPDATYATIPNADHGLSGHQKEVGKLIAQWLSK